MDAEIPLGPEDRAILDLEGPTVAGHTCKVVLMSRDAPPVGALRDAIAARLDAAPPLRWRLGGSPDAPVWVTGGTVDLDRQVTAVAVDAPLGDRALRAEVARLFERRLDRDRPLWQLDVVPYRDGAALVWRIHHALADGTTAMRFARAVLWDDEAAAARPAPPPGPAHAAADDARRRHLAGFLARELSRSRDRSPFDGRIGRRREIAFARVALEPLHAAARETAGATVNDAVLAIVAGALRRWLLAHHGPLGDVRARVPVSLHREGDAEGNRDAFFAVALPLDEPDALERLRRVHAATAVCKEDHDAETMDELLRELGAVSPRLRAFADRVERSPRRFAVSVSNVPGPRTPVSVLGAPVDALHAIAEIGERHALRVAVVSVAGLLCFGLCADPAIVVDLQAMADGVVAEAALLTA